MPNAMNLDLNLGLSSSLDNNPVSISLSNEFVTLDDWIDGQRVDRLRESDRLSVWLPVPIPPENRNIALELINSGNLGGSSLQPIPRENRNIALELMNSSNLGSSSLGPIPPDTRNIALELMMNSSSLANSSLQAGEGSILSEGKDNEACENNETHEGDRLIGKRVDEERDNREEGSFFDCNICLELARDPVVTSCGHLFCWPCLYQWLHVHSDAKECPVCKGEVTVKNVTPIYGSGNKTHEPEEDPSLIYGCGNHTHEPEEDPSLIYGRGTNTHEPEEDTSLKIPARPRARRIESWRQTFQRNRFPFAMEEMIRRLGSRFDLMRDLVQVYPQNTDNVQNDSPARNNSLLSRILTSSGMRREQNTEVGRDDVVDAEVAQDGNHRLSSVLRRRSHRASSISYLSSALTSYFQYHHVEGNQEQPPEVDDRDSMSSIAAIIHSESQTVDTAVEIDSTVLASTSSSRRQYDASRVSDVDSSDSRPHRRRRFV